MNQERIARCRALKADYNCAQAVAIGFADAVNADEALMEHVCRGCGGGMGNMEGTCGAIVGACIVAGMASHNRNDARKRAAQIMKKFKERNSTTICRELKGIDTRKVLRLCPDCVADAAEFLDEIIDEINDAQE